MRFILPLCLLSTFLLSACWMGDRLVEETSCPRGGEITLRHNDTAPPLNIPQSFDPVCAISHPQGRDRTISEVSLVVSYPALTAAPGREADALQDREIFIRITPAYGRRENPDQNRLYLEQNLAGVDASGQKVFAPPAGLGSNMYVQRNINGSGLADTYFYQDQNGHIPLVMLCAPARRCEGHFITHDSAYRIDYFFTGIQPVEFSALELKLRDFVAGLYSAR